MYKGAIVLLLGVSVVLAGCVGSPGGGSTVTSTDDEVTHEVKIVNVENTSHTVSVTVQQGGETVLNEERNLSDGAEWDVTTQSNPGNYTVVVTTDSGDRLNESYALPLAESDRRSFTVFRVSESGTLDVRTYWQE
jgi:hypothetical protein